AVPKRPENNRGKRKNRCDGSGRRRENRPNRKRQKPQEVVEGHAFDHLQVATPDPRQILIRMTTMLAVPFVGHEDPPQRRRRRITCKMPEDDEPRPETDV